MPQRNYRLTAPEDDWAETFATLEAALEWAKDDADEPDLVLSVYGDGWLIHLPDDMANYFYSVDNA